MFNFTIFVSISHNAKMNTNKKIPDKGDPSDIIQVFPNYNIDIHCCRYWWLQKWEFKELSFPYWRIYHNSYKGAVILYNGKEFDLTPDKIIMIAPNTSYATRLYDHQIPEQGYSLKGGRVSSGLDKSTISIDPYILHLFIHFNIGMPYDNVSSGVFEYKITDHLKDKLQIIKQHLNYEHSKFSFYTSLSIQSLISDLLSELPEERWNIITKDTRILKVLNLIENKIDTDLSNPKLAVQAQMATNAFTRLFVDEINISPQKYVKKKRIDQACILLHHSSFSIDQVAAQTGFADRYHFSRIFKQITGLSPAKYRKDFGM